MKKKPLELLKISTVGVFCAAMLPLSLHAQTTTEETTQFQNLEEIIVTGRKREESLQDIPVSVSVLSASTLLNQNVIDQGTLAELVPGLHYNEGDAANSDRIAALPSIRGISATEIATTSTKVSSFVDGIPIVGSVGSINIGGATQVEVYNGPQSAAFGRSTFAGAINYVTADPSEEEITGSIGANWSDQGTRIINGSVGGPISDTLGFQLGGSFEDSVSPDSDIYTYSDGNESGTRGGNNVSARLVWTPSDVFKAKLTFSHDETEDGATGTFYADQQSSQECFNSLDTFEYVGGMGAELGVIGEFDCEFELDRTAGLQAVNNISRFFEENPAALAAQVDSAVASGATAITTSSGETFSVEDAILLVADAYSIDDSDVGSSSERDRIMTQLEYYFSDDSIVQLSLMTSKEDYIRQSSGFNSTVPYDFSYSLDPMTGDGTYAYAADIMGMVDTITSDPTTIDENYLELRWASPGDQRARYVVGASYYDYNFSTEIFDGVYGAVVGGFTSDFDDLTGLESAVADRVISQNAENTALFFNASYDFSDRITGSLEGRYSNDKVGAFLPSTGISETQTSNSFTPRIALTYNLDDNTSLYLQYAVGINPGGINADLLDPTLTNLLDNGVPVALDPNNPNDIALINSVDYDSATYVGYDEETLTNFEFGFKGSLLDGRLSYSGAVYFQEWEDALQRTNLDWDYTFADDDLAGTLVAGTTDTFYTAETDDTNATVFANSGTSETMGIELQGSYRINDKWSVNANTSLMDASHSDFCDEDLYTGNPGDLGEIAGLDVSTTDLGALCYVLDGKQLTRQPSFTLSLSPSYRTELANGLALNAGLRLQHQSSSYADAVNIEENPATQTVNLTLGLSKDAWTTSFYVNNLLDDTSTTGRVTESARFEENYPNNVVDQSLLFGSNNEYSSYTYRIPTGRNFGVRVGYRF